MPQVTLYAYVDGSDLHDVAVELEAKLDRFVEGEDWCVRRPWVVNQRQDDDPELEAGDLPQWDLGLNLELPDPGDEPPGWFSDVEKIARFLGELHAITGRDFAIGYCDNERGFSEDIDYITTQEPDLRGLRQMMGLEADGQ